MAGRSGLKTTILRFGFAAAVLAFSPSFSSAQSGNPQSLFDSRCSACHTIGGGAKVGPDLSVVKSWPEAALRSKVESMQAQAGPLKQGEIDTLVALLRAGDRPAQTAPGTAPRRGSTASARSGKAGQPAPGLQGPGDWNSPGAQLYSGRYPFTNGGMACMSCHAIQGGGMGPSLREVAGEKAGPRLYFFLQNPENRAMRNAYAAHPITGPEAAALSNYFATLRGSFARGDDDGGRLPQMFRKLRRFGEMEGDDD